jgi:methylated-DNA-[protein]-cysteine S-methyltransferase
MVNIIKHCVKNKKELTDKKCNGIAYYSSPTGLIKVCSNGQGISALDFVNEKYEQCISDKITDNAIKQLAEYFEGKRKEFDLPVYIEGTEFQLRVWEMLTKVKYGETASYKDMAKLVDNEKTSRAIGGANNKNPVGIILPCHRVIGSNGKLVGYAGGLDKKQWLLEHEMKNK